MQQTTIVIPSRHEYKMWKCREHIGIIWQDAIIRCNAKLYNIFHHSSIMFHHGSSRRRYKHPSKSSLKWFSIKFYGCECPLGVWQDAWCKFNKCDALGVKNLPTCKLLHVSTSIIVIQYLQGLAIECPKFIRGSNKD